VTILGTQHCVNCIDIQFPMSVVLVLQKWSWWMTNQWLDVTWPVAGRTLSAEDGLRTLLNLSSALIVAVKSPEPGEWTLRVGAGGEASIRVTGLSPLAFSHGFSRAPGPVNQRHAQPRPITGQYSFRAPASLIYGQLSTYDTIRYRNQLKAWRIASIVYHTMKKNENLLKCAMLSTRILQLHASNTLTTILPFTVWPEGRSVLALGLPCHGIYHDLQTLVLIA